MSISKSKWGLMVLKIDLEKAFDKLEQGFIKHILSFFNFPTDWIELIMSCISISSLLVLINEERLNYFLSSRGIRQGDPLSLYIFILCMEYLASLILYVVNAHSWPGIRISRDGPTFSHLFFADDLILLLRPPNGTTILLKTLLITSTLFLDRKSISPNPGFSSLPIPLQIALMPPKENSV